MPSESAKRIPATLGRAEENLDRVRPSGAVQPHAVVLTLHPVTGQILQASANAADLLGKPRVLGCALKDILGEPKAEFLQAEIPKIVDHRPPLFAGRFEFARSQSSVFVHKNDGVVVLELEQDGPQLFPSSMTLRGRAQDNLRGMQETPNVHELLTCTVGIIARDTGFERVLAFQFLPGGGGQIVAEMSAPGFERRPSVVFSEPWLGGTVRHLPNTGYEPVPLEPKLNPVSGRPLDLGLSLFGETHPAHAGRLRDLGIQATMTLPLQRGSEPWGVILCTHHSGPRHVPHEVRAACEMLVQSVSLLLGGREVAEDQLRRQQLESLRGQILDAMVHSASFSDAFLSPAIDALGPLAAEGMAIAIGEALWMRGTTPPAGEIRDLLKDVSSRMENDRSADVFAAGRVLAMRAARAKSHFVLWFRPLHEGAMHWSVPGTGPLPAVERESIFKPWREYDTGFAGALGRAIGEIALERARDQADTTLELAKRHREIEAYLFLASHDLKEPLRGIHNYAQLLQRSAKERLTAEETVRLASVVRLARRMDALIENLLEFSRAGHDPRPFESVNVGEICEDVVSALRPLSQSTGAEVRIAQAMPQVHSDGTALRTIFKILITNALQYNTNHPKWVEVGCQLGEIPTFYVRDNGIGIALEDREEIFRIFKRLHRREEFGGGAGAGLSIARRTVERLRGRMWIESTVGEGSTFFFSIGHERA